jgi:hypothetical protein
MVVTWKFTLGELNMRTIIICATLFFASAAAISITAPQAYACEFDRCGW